MNAENLEFLNIIVKSSLFCDVIPSLEVRFFIACQFALESDFGRSNRALSDSNISGMKQPFRRLSCCIGSTDDGFAIYKGWYECKLDYIMWLLYNRPHKNAVENLDSFIIFLRNSGYCPEKDYIDKIQSIYKIYFKN